MCYIGGRELQMLMNPLLERLEDSVNKNNEILDALAQ